MITPTECSLSSNELEVNLVSQHITAGKTLPNYAFYIVDEDLNLQPTGFPGEICIVDADVAIGYLNNPEQTERKFLWASFADKMYRTGDKGVLRADGTFDILGRIDGDTQVKLRGLRIELKISSSPFSPLPMGKSVKSLSLVATQPSSSPTRFYHQPLQQTPMSSSRLSLHPYPSHSTCVRPSCLPLIAFL